MQFCIPFLLKGNLPLWFACSVGGCVFDEAKKPLPWLLESVLD
jgi:hypothetical protein